MSYKPQGHYKSSDLSPILLSHFGKYMNLARIKAMSMMICALCKVQQVAYTKLAAAFDGGATACSSLRRIQRLIAECVIDADLVAKLILKPQPVKGPYDLAMDRTNRKFSDTDMRTSRSCGTVRRPGRTGCSTTWEWATASIPTVSTT